MNLIKYSVYVQETMEQENTTYFILSKNIICCSFVGNQRFANVFLSYAQLCAKSKLKMHLSKSINFLNKQNDTMDFQESGLTVYSPLISLAVVPKANADFYCDSLRPIEDLKLIQNYLNINFILKSSLCSACFDNLKI